MFSVLPLLDEHFTRGKPPFRSRRVGRPKTTKKGQNWAALGGKQEQRPNWTLPLRQWEELLRIGELKRGR